MTLILLLGNLGAMAGPELYDLSAGGGADRYGNVLLLRDPRALFEYVVAVAGNPCEVAGQPFGKPRQSVKRFWFEDAAYRPFDADVTARGKGISLMISWTSPFELAPDQPEERGVINSEFRETELIVRGGFTQSSVPLPDLERLMFPYCGLTQHDVEPWKVALTGSPRWARRYLASLLAHWILWERDARQSSDDSIQLSGLFSYELMDYARDCGRRKRCEHLLQEIEQLRFYPKLE